MPKRGLLAIMLSLSLSAQLLADDEQDTRPSTPAVFRPYYDEAPAGNAALFIGINEFNKDANIPPLRFAVHDAIEQAHLFVLRLNLIPPKNCYIALSGTPGHEKVKENLAELERLGVHVLDADKSSVLKSLQTVCAAATESSELLIIGISSHGFDDGTVPYVMPRDGLRSFLADTAIRLRSIENQMRKSDAGHRLFLVDACQERVSVAAEKSVTAKPTSRMNTTFQDALKESTGQAKLTSCDVGEFSYEYADLRGCGHGVFTAHLLDALDGGAEADDKGLICMRKVADYVHKGVNQWIDDQNRHGGGDMKQSPSWFGPKSAEDLPLAVTAGDVLTLITRFQDHDHPPVIEVALQGEVIKLLENADAELVDTKRLISSTQKYLSGKLNAEEYKYIAKGTLDSLGSPKPGIPPTGLMRSPVPLELTGSEPGETRAITSYEINLCWCPPGLFLRDAVIGAEKVRLTQGFWMGQTEVTRELWCRIQRPLRSWLKDGGDARTSQLPANYVNYFQATEFCQELTHRCHQDGSLPKDWRFALPTEAQWEYTCRAGSASFVKFAEAENALEDQAWYRNEVQQLRSPQQVKLKQANSWNVFDMHGNVEEWCRDFFGPMPPNGIDPVARRTPLAPVVAWVTKGGSYATGGGDCLPNARRERDCPDNAIGRTTYKSYGFRLALVHEDQSAWEQVQQQ